MLITNFLSPTISKRYCSPFCMHVFICRIRLVTRYQTSYLSLKTMYSVDPIFLNIVSLYFQYSKNISCCYSKMKLNISRLQQPSSFSYKERQVEMYQLNCSFSHLFWYLHCAGRNSHEDYYYVIANSFHPSCPN